MKTTLARLKDLEIYPYAGEGWNILQSQLVK